MIWFFSFPFILQKDSFYHLIQRGDPMLLHFDTVCSRENLVRQLYWQPASKMPRAPEQQMSVRVIPLCFGHPLNTLVQFRAGYASHCVWETRKISCSVTIWTSTIIETVDSTGIGTEKLHILLRGSLEFPLNAPDW